MSSDQGSAAPGGDAADAAALLRRAQTIRLTQQLLSDDPTAAEHAALTLMSWDDEDDGDEAGTAPGAMMADDQDLLLLADAAVGPIDPEASRALLARPDLLRVLSLTWLTDCPPPHVLDHALAAERAGEPAPADLVRSAHAGTCARCARVMGPGVLAADWTVDDRALEEVVTEWRLELVLTPAGARTAGQPAGGLDARAAAGELRIPTLADAGVHPRLVWRKEGTDPAVLVLALARLESDDDDRSPGGAPQLLATVEQEPGEWTAFAANADGHLEARIVLRRDDDRAVLPLRLRLAGGPA